ncbi:bifunctional alpha/beta hydrolase/OsmC family protein [Inmirania thermothiophila]|uniref:Putative redox protein n=1 Tax=Inmirania thermothiophila TaxID=1750597 RepID=A0A3N1YAF0_9GAMM|nr:bifunctional alpha/beta hydrolase/OsmC family protein [Inmirania thermothiophila]ROR34602.1 putative redox protein [Inmirania thermothiophila]
MTRSIRLQFDNGRGERLGAVLDRPLGRPVAYALFAHCFTCGKNLKAAAHIAAALARQGIATLRFDFTGLGESEGEFAGTGFLANVEDLVAAAEYLAAEHGPARILVGHSLGGAAVLAAAARVPEAAAVATIGAPADPAHVTHLLGDAVEVIRREGEAEVRLAGRPFRIRRRFLEDLEAVDLPAAVAALRRPLLILHSPRDTVVGIDNAARIFQAAKHPKSFVSLDRADHLLSDEADSRYVGTVIAAWAARYLEHHPEEQAEAEPAVNQVVARIGRERYLTEICANGHALLADEPVRVGGGNRGPNPYDLLVSALGACTAMTLRMYADRKGWPLEAVEVRLDHAKIHARDCERCQEKDGMVDRIEREIVLEGALDETQRQRLLEIADRCPVHRTLHGEVEVRTRLAG